MKKLAIEIPGR